MADLGYSTVKAIVIGTAARLSKGVARRSAASLCGCAKMEFS
jgi:hypothetical protein